MPQLQTSLHFRLTPIVIINGSSRRDLILDSQDFCRSVLAGAQNPPLPQLYYRTLRGSRNRRALILGVGLLQIRCFQQLSTLHLATKRLPWAR
ncbi:hypothetical protein AAC387_Pa03g4369 [Persea americana]